MWSCIFLKKKKKIKIKKKLALNKWEEILVKVNTVRVESIDNFPGVPVRLTDRKSVSVAQNQQDTPFG